MKKKSIYRQWTPKLMDGALASLPAQIIRDGAPGLEHMEALILLRGGELQPVALKIKRTLRPGALKRIIFSALRDRSDAISVQKPLRNAQTMFRQTEQIL